MADVLSTKRDGVTLFPPHLVGDLINKVKGKSAIAALSGSTPIPFNGLKEFTFTMDSEVDIVAENGKKTPASLKIEPRTMIPLKVEYGARVSDEFMYASEEEGIGILQSFNEGYARKLAKGLDLMAFHGVNPRTAAPSDIIGTNCFDKAVNQIVNDSAATADAMVEAAIALVQASEYDVTGMAMSPAFRAMLAAMRFTGSGERMFPDLAWGNAPGSINGLPVQVNSTVSAIPFTDATSGTNATDLAIIGDFGTAFRWGYAKQIPMEIIRYGDPDNTGKDLKGYNQIYIRCETYLGWAVLDPDSFAIIREDA